MTKSLKIANAEFQETIGAVQFFAMDSAPTGWLKANGAAVSRVSYADLFERIGITYGAGDGSTTFNLPDIRGEFIRGWDDSRGVDSSRGLGSLQGDDNKSHSHTASSNTTGNHSHYYGGSNEDGGEPGSLVVTHYGQPNGNRYSSTAGDHSHTITVNASGGSETRPRNIALLGCIKY